MASLRPLLSGRRWSLIASVLMLLFVTACGAGDGDEAAAPDDPEPDSPPADDAGDDGDVSDQDLPDRIADSGVINVGVYPGFKPVAFYPEGTEDLQGSDPDLMEAIAAELGLEVQWHPMAEFGGLLTGIESRRFDAAMTGISDTLERQQIVTFVNYMTETKVWLTKADNPNDVSEALTSACGLTVATQSGTLDHEYYDQLEEACEAEGLEAPDRIEFAQSTDKKLAVESERVDVSFFSGMDVPALQEESGDAFAAFRIRDLPEELFGIALHPEDEALHRAMQSALQSLMDSSRYTEILANWGLENLTITEATINAGRG